MKYYELNWNAVVEIKCDSESSDTIDIGTKAFERHIGSTLKKVDLQTIVTRVHRRC